MADYINIDAIEEEDILSFCLVVENSKMMEIGEKMNAINEMAYMNGYNWEAVIMHYVSIHQPSLLEGMDPDPEAGAFFATYELTDENRKKAEELKSLLINLIESEEIYAFIEKEGDNISWD